MSSLKVSYNSGIKIKESEKYKVEYLKCLEKQIKQIKKIIRQSKASIESYKMVNPFMAYLLFLLCELYIKHSYLRLIKSFDSFANISNLLRERNNGHNLYYFLCLCEIDSIIDNRKREMFEFLKNQIEVHGYENNIKQYINFRYGTSLDGGSKYKGIKIDLKELYVYVSRV